MTSSLASLSAADPTALLAIGSTVSITNLYDATYIGEVVSVAGDLVTLRNHSAWYDGDTAPYNSPYFDDEVQVRVDAETVVDVQDTSSAQLAPAASYSHPGYGHAPDGCAVCATIPAYVVARNARR